MPITTVLRFAALALIAIAVSAVASPLAGGVVLALGLVVLISYEATRPSGLLRDAEHAPHPHGGRRHVVVVADAALAGDELAEAIVIAAGRDAELDVLAPSSTSPWSMSASEPVEPPGDGHGSRRPESRSVPVHSPTVRRNCR